MQPSSHPHSLPLRQSKLSDQQCTASFLDNTSAFPRDNFSLPSNALQESMSKFQRQAREQLNLSHLVEQLALTLQELIEGILHDKIHKEITRVVNEVLCIREEVTLFAKEGSLRQEDINETVKGEIRKLKKRVDELSSRSGTLHFQYYLQEGKDKVKGQGGGGVQGVVRDVYEFMHKNDASKLFRECEGKFQKLHQQMQQQGLTLSEKIQQATKRQKPINENLRKQLSDALSKEVIRREVKKCLKENIRYLFDELVRSRKDIEQLRAELNGLNERQRELEFSQTLLEHKIA